MFERLRTPEEAYNHKLGAALKMEHTVLDKILADAADEAQDERLQRLFRHHAQETRNHISNIEKAFEALGWEIDDSPCPVIEAIHKEGKLNIKKTDKDIVDEAILASAIETEHHEIAVYEALIVEARAIGRQDVATLLTENLEQEQHTLDEVRRALTGLVGANAPNPVA